MNYKQAQDKLNHEKEKAKKDAELAESRLITERFSKAVEQLGSDKIDARIGGIYALEQIAKDSGKYKDLDGYQWKVMEILTAFIRERSPVQEKEKLKTDETSGTISLKEQPQTSQDLNPVTADVQAALTIIGRRKIMRDRDCQELGIDITKG
ncbi:MAG: hypothetical protein ACP5RH_07485 [Leptodesmis sp.]|uniref:hypothetical protein n=1 Tax=Leptodesmis sp. TaxID=3100501 RepID=UPI003D0C8D9F